MNLIKVDFRNSVFIRKSPIYKELKKERILIGSGKSLAYKKEAIKNKNIVSKYFISITYKGFETSVDDLNEYKGELRWKKH